MRLAIKSRLKRGLQLVDSYLWNFLKSGHGAPEPDKTIYDVGLHVGQDTDFYLQKGFRVVAVEANPSLVARANEVFRDAIDGGALIVVNCGVAESDSDEDIPFYVNETLEEWSSFDKELACREGHPHHVVNVKCRTLASLVEEYGPPFYVKIDIEGNDLVALKSLIGGGNRPRYISVENGNNGMLRLLSNAGYDSFKYIQQRDVEKQRAPFPPLHGNFVRFPFRRGASGLFGEETPGDWLPEAMVRQEIAKVWNPDGPDKNPGHDDRLSGWFDLHARLSL